MPGRKKQDSASRSKAGKGGQPTKRPITLGTDPALTLPTPQGNTLQLSYWDLWFALVAVKDFGGDLDRLAERLVRSRGSNPSTEGRPSVSGATCVT